jgi:hypothetical protein
MATATTEITQGGVERLLREIAGYLGAVEAFRAEGVEPCWANDETLPEWWLAEWRVECSADAGRGQLEVA